MDRCRRTVRAVGVGERVADQQSSCVCLNQYRCAGRLRECGAIPSPPRVSLNLRCRRGCSGAFILKLHDCIVEAVHKPGSFPLTAPNRLNCSCRSFCDHLAVHCISFRPQLMAHQPATHTWLNDGCARSLRGKSATARVSPDGALNHRASCSLPLVFSLPCTPACSAAMPCLDNSRCLALYLLYFCLNLSNQVGSFQMPTHVRLYEHRTRENSPIVHPLHSTSVGCLDGGRRPVFSLCTLLSSSL